MFSEPIAKKYEIWDLQTGNYLETVDSKEELDNVIEEYVKLEGEDYRQYLGIRGIPD